MADRNKEPSNNEPSKRHMEESVSSGRITQAEADVIKRFFAAPSENWPGNELQRRMQGSGG